MEEKEMKTLKIVAVLSMLVLMLIIAEFAALPFQNPNSVIAWRAILLYGYFLFCLCILPPLGLLLSLASIRKVMIGMTITSFLLVILGSVSIVFEMIFIAGLFAFDYSISKVLKNKTIV
jgi:hypothetical protein